jgi:tetratricopeptide (TPR) repeat protein
MKTTDLWANGDAAFDEGRYNAAIPYYDEILHRNSNESRALLQRGVAKERDGDDLGALRDYGAAGDLGDSRATLYSANLNNSRGDTSGSQGDMSQLSNAGLTGANRIVQLVLLGTLRLEQGKPRMAAQNFERAIAEGAQHADYSTRGHVANAHYNAGQAYYQLGDFDRAYNHMRGYMQVADASSGAGANDQYMLGLLAYLAGDFEASDAALAKADPAEVAQGAKILDDPSFGGGGSP